MLDSKFENIYVVCPIGTKTGGTELLHQLVYEINKLAGKSISFIVYTGDTVNIKPAKAFETYTNKKWLTLDQVDDKKKT